MMEDGRARGRGASQRVDESLVQSTPSVRFSLPSEEEAAHARGAHHPLYTPPRKTVTVQPRAGDDRVSRRRSAEARASNIEASSARHGGAEGEETEPSHSHALSVDDRGSSKGTSIEKRSDGVSDRRSEGRNDGSPVESAPSRKEGRKESKNAGKKEAKKRALSSQEQVFVQNFGHFGEPLLRRQCQPFSDFDPDFGCTIRVEGDLVERDGRMFLTKHHILFYSPAHMLRRYQAFMKVISFKDVTRLVKRNTALVIPDAIEVVYADGDNSCLFSSFVNRDSGYAILDRLLQVNREEDDKLGPKRTDRKRARSISSPVQLRGRIEHGTTGSQPTDVDTDDKDKRVPLVEGTGMSPESSEPRDEAEGSAGNRAARDQAPSSPVRVPPRENAPSERVAASPSAEWILVHERGASQTAAAPTVRVSPPHEHNESDSGGIGLDAVIEKEDAPSSLKEPWTRASRAADRDLAPSRPGHRRTGSNIANHRDEFEAQRKKRLAWEAKHIKVGGFSVKKSTVLVVICATVTVMLALWYSSLVIQAQSEIEQWKVAHQSLASRAAFLEMWMSKLHGSNLTMVRGVVPQEWREAQQLHWKITSWRKSLDELSAQSKKMISDFKDKRREWRLLERDGLSALSTRHSHLWNNPYAKACAVQRE